MNMLDNQTEVALALIIISLCYGVLIWVIHEIL